METRALEGAVSIFVMFIVLMYPIMTFAQDLFNQFATFITLGVIIVVGLINGFIFKEDVKKAIVYMVAIGELCVIAIFALFYTSLQQQIGNTDPGLTGLGLIFVLILLFVILIAGAIGFLVFGVLVFIPALVGKKLSEKN